MKILSIKDYSDKLNATVQLSGRLVFSGETATALQLDDKKEIVFAQGDDDKLYCSFPQEELADSFKIRKSGNFFYVPTVNLFKALSINFEEYKISFNLVRDPAKDEEMKGNTYRMDMTIGNPRKKEESEDGEKKIDSNDNANSPDPEIEDEPDNEPNMDEDLSE